MKPKRCKACRKPFIPVKPLQVACGYECALLIAKNKRVKAEKQVYKAEKERIKSRGDHIKEAQFAVNAYIRARDQGKPCISCSRPTKAGDHAGHWKPTSTSPALRFTETNIHLQCIQCNLHLHGNVAAYRTGLLERIGQAEVELLEAPHPPAKWAIEDLKQIKALYKLKLKQLKEQ